MGFKPSMKINIDDYKNFSHQDFVEHAINLRKNKGQHSEFWYVLDDLVEKIKIFKERTKITKPELEAKSDRSIPKSSKKLISAKHISSKKSIFNQKATVMTPKVSPRNSRIINLK